MADDNLTTPIEIRRELKLLSMSAKGLRAYVADRRKKGKSVSSKALALWEKYELDDYLRHPGGSRNQREGHYYGLVNGRHRRSRKASKNLHL